MGTRLEFDFSTMENYFKKFDAGKNKAFSNSLNNTVRSTRQDMIGLFSKTFNIKRMGPARGRGSLPPGASGQIRAKKSKSNVPINAMEAKIDVASRPISAIHFTKNKSVSTGAKRRKVRVEVLRGRAKVIGRRFVAKASKNSSARQVFFRSKTEKSIREVTLKSGRKYLKRDDLIKKARAPSLFQLSKLPSIDTQIQADIEKNWSRSMSNQLSKLHRRAS